MLRSPSKVKNLAPAPRDDDYFALGTASPASGDGGATPTKSLSSSSLNKMRWLDRNNTPSRRNVPSPKTPSRLMFHRRLPSLNVVTEKNRLVEQFYTSVNETRAEESPLKAAAPAIDGNFTNKTFDEVIGRGGLTYEPVERTLDDSLAHYLMNIDAVTNEYKEKETHLVQNANIVEVPEMEPLVNVLKKVVELMEKDICNELRRPSPTSKTHLGRLSTYLESLAHTIESIGDELMAQKDSLMSKYKQRIQHSVGKLDELVVSLEALELRLAAARTLINTNKQEMSSDIGDKFEVLDYINRRFDEHARVTRKRRLKQLNVTLAAVVVVGGVWMYLRVG